MKKMLAVFLMVFMAACFTPDSGFAKSGNGHGNGSHSGNQTGDQDGTGPDRDRLQDGSCDINIDGTTTLAANSRRGKRTGPQDGSGPRRNGSCLSA